MGLSNIYGAARVLIDNDYHRIGKDLISPFNPEFVQPASYDVTLHDEILVPREPPDLRVWQERRSAAKLDLRTCQPSALMAQGRIFDGGYGLGPGKCALVCTRETVTCPNDMICSVDGKSTLGRCFLAVHVTAGFIDPGFVGRVTLELVNHSPWTFVLYPGMRIGQLRFTWLAKEVDRSYGSPDLNSHYQGSLSVRPATTDVKDRHGNES